jgi:hypothetical protein
MKETGEPLKKPISGGYPFWGPPHSLNFPGEYANLKVNSGGWEK